MVVWSPPTPLDNSTQSLVQVFIAGPVDGFDQGETHYVMGGFIIIEWKER